MSITITEALAEIKTVGKRIDAKRAAILPYLLRQDGAKDPLEKELDGGSVEYIKRERQALDDLGMRIIALRQGIQKANDSNSIVLSGVSKTISEWLTWRREVAPGAQKFLNQIRGNLNSIREQAKRQGNQVVPAGTVAAERTDYLINVDEKELNRQIEEFEEILGSLDGQLSLKNATVQIGE
jgi:hypothetical protein